MGFIAGQSLVHLNSPLWVFLTQTVIPPLLPQFLAMHSFNGWFLRTSFGQGMVVPVIRKTENKGGHCPVSHFKQGHHVPPKIFANTRAAVVELTWPVLLSTTCWELQHLLCWHWSVRNLCSSPLKAQPGKFISARAEFSYALCLALGWLFISFS